MIELFNQLWAQAQGSLNNQFLSGGLVLGAIGGAVAYGRRLPKRLWTLFLYYNTVSVEITSDDRAYRELLVWLDAQPYAKRTRCLNAKQVHIGGINRTILVPARGNHVFWWNRTVVWLNRRKEAPAGGTGSTSPQSLEAMMQAEMLDITTLGRSRASILLMLEQAKEMCQDKESNLQPIYNYIGSWDYTLKTPRPLKTVFLPDSASGLLADMEGFLKNKAWYDERGIPYHRGYLFHGPPGGGKTTTAQALAASLKINLYVLNLASFGTDSSLQGAFARIDDSEPFMLLLEDVDTAMPGRELDKEKKTFSLGTLLNMLDGVQSNEKMILVMTTNLPDKLDAALLRPGRVDKMIEFCYASDTQIQQAIELYYPDRIDEVTQLASAWERPISVAQVQENLRNLSWELKDIVEVFKVENEPAHVQEEMLSMSESQTRDSGPSRSVSSGSFGRESGSPSSRVGVSSVSQGARVA